MKKEIKAGKEAKTAGAQKAGGRIRKATHYKRAPVRLWVKGKFLGFRRSKEVQKPNQALLKIEGVNDTCAANFYHGKRCVYIYKAPTKRLGTKFRTIWGRVAKSHGGKGLVIARFSPNLPARAMGSTIRIMLYPSTN